MKRSPHVHANVQRYCQLDSSVERSSLFLAKELPSQLIALVSGKTPRNGVVLGGFTLMGSLVPSSESSK